MKRVCIIQARMGSTRLPGKVLVDVAGKPMLAQQIRRLRHCKAVDEIVIATSDNATDKPIVDLARREDVGWFWNHAEDRDKIAHDYLFVNYVCSSGKHYPLEFRRFKKRDQCEEAGVPFEDHGVLFRQLIAWVCDHEIPGDFTFDSYFSGA